MSSFRNIQEEDFFARKLKEAELRLLEAGRSGTPEEQREAIAVYQQFENIDLALHKLETSRKQNRQKNKSEGD